MLALALSVLAAVAYTFPLHFASKTKVTLGTSVLFATILLFEPAVAMLVVASGRLWTQVVRRAPGDEALLNGSQTVLQAGVGALILSAWGWTYSGLRLGRPEHLLAICLAGAAIYLVNTLSVATIIALESSQSPLTVWRESTAISDAAERLPQFALGLLAAIVADAQPWALPLLLLPAVAVYRLSERHVLLHKQSSDLAHQAYHDPLTGLGNRVQLLDRLEQALTADNGLGTPVALIYLDLDNFKMVNDTFGHEVGDSLLVAVGGRLRACARPEDTVARLGGDEFAILLHGIADEEDAILVANRITERLRDPFTIAGHDLLTTSSIGVAVAASGRDGPADVLREADTAMYRAKRAGKAAMYCSASEYE